MGRGEGLGLGSMFDIWNRRDCVHMLLGLRCLRLGMSAKVRAGRFWVSSCFVQRPAKNGEPRLRL